MAVDITSSGEVSSDFSLSKTNKKSWVKLSDDLYFYERETVSSVSGSDVSSKSSVCKFVNKKSLLELLSLDAFNTGELEILRKNPSICYMTKEQKEEYGRIGPLQYEEKYPRYGSIEDIKSLIHSGLYDPDGFVVINFSTCLFEAIDGTILPYPIEFNYLQGIGSDVYDLRRMLEHLKTLDGITFLPGPDDKYRKLTSEELTKISSIPYYNADYESGRTHQICFSLLLSFDAMSALTKSIIGSSKKKREISDNEICRRILSDDLLGLDQFKYDHTDGFRP